MPIEVSWANPQKTIILTEYREMWTLEEFHASVDEMYELATSVEHNLYFITDFTYSKASPTRLLSTGRHIENKSAPNVVMTIMVGANPFLKAMLAMAEKIILADFHIKTANTVEQAFEMIKQHQVNSARHR